METNFVDKKNSLKNEIQMIDKRQSIAGLHKFMRAISGRSSADARRRSKLEQDLRQAEQEQREYEDYMSLVSNSQELRLEIYDFYSTFGRVMYNKSFRRHIHGENVFYRLSVAVEGVREVAEKATKMKYRLSDNDLRSIVQECGGEIFSEEEIAEDLRSIESLEEIWSDHDTVDTPESESDKDIISVPIARFDRITFAILEHVTEPRGLSNDHDVEFFSASCEACGVEFPGSALSRLATRIRAREMGLQIVMTSDGSDIYACPRCNCVNAAVTLCNMTKDEADKIKSAL